MAKGHAWAGILVVGAAVGIGATLWARPGLHRDATPAGVIVASGRLEAEQVRVAAGTTGRVRSLPVAEGQPVEEGRLVARLDDREPAAAVASARAGLAAARAAVAAAEDHIAISESRRQVAVRDAARFRRLFDGGAVSRQSVEHMEAAATQLEGEEREARAAQEVAQGRVRVARAAIDAAQIALDETTVTSPVAGVVAELVARVGELVPAGVPLLVIRRTDDTRLRVYLPLADAERVHPGLEARIYPAAWPDRVFSGTVLRIAERAEFTPRDIHMPDERTTLVYAVELRVDDPDGELKDGFPADAYIRWRSDAPWPAGPPW